MSDRLSLLLKEAARRLREDHNEGHLKDDPAWENLREQIRQESLLKTQDQREDALELFFDTFERSKNN